MELDEKNKFIFENLLFNARVSVKQLAKGLKITKPAIVKRIQFLENEKFIDRYDAIINWQKLPLLKKVYFVKKDNRNDVFENKILSQKSVFSFITLVGIYTYQIWCFFKDLSQQKKFEMMLGKNNWGSININELVFPKISFFDIQNKSEFMEFKDKDISLGKIDVTLLKYMAEGHGRDSFYEMSKILKIPYDSLHYHGKNLIAANYFSSIVAQPGSNKFTLQTNSLLIDCFNKSSSVKLFVLLKKTPKILSNAIGDNNKVLVHFLSQNQIDYKETFSKILSLIPKTEIKEVLITHWENILLNNRYPLDYLLSFK